MDHEDAVSLAAFLESRGLNEETLPPAGLRRMKAAEKAVEARMGETRKAKELAFKNRLTITGITEDLGIARGTAYNDKLLRSYIEHARGIQKKLFDDADGKNKRLSSENAALKESLRKMLIRDVESEELKYEIASLRKEVRFKDNQIEHLNNVNAQLEKNLRRVEEKLVRSSIKALKGGS